MRNKYTKPAIECIDITTETMLAVSNNIEVGGSTDNFDAPARRPQGDLWKDAGWK